MIKLQANARELFEGHVDAGITMWWVPGQRVVLHQTWEHRAAGREYGEVLHSYTSGDLVDYFYQNQWNDEYSIVDITDIGEPA
jgi:hypothetical protein